MHGFYNMHLIPGRMVWRPSTRGLGKRLWFNRWTGVARGKTRELVRTVCCHEHRRLSRHTRETRTLRVAAHSTIYGVAGAQPLAHDELRLAVSLRIWLAQSAVSAAVASDLRTIVVFWMLVSARKLQPES